MNNPKLHHKKDIPNQEGFRFLAVMNDNSIKEQSVNKDSKGFHYVDDYGSIKGFFSIATANNHSMQFLTKLAAKLEYNEIRNKFINTATNGR